MKKVIISTYTHWTSFGSVLQSVGLQFFLRKISIEPKTITFIKDESIPAIVKQRLQFNLAFILYVYKLIHKKKLELGRERSLKFIRDNVSTISFNSYDEICFEKEDADVFIAGSDQVWHPDLCRPDFFLDYVINGKRRISYAASMGKTFITANKEATFANLLQNFDAISVREADMIPIISKYTKTTVEQHIDPTFLMSKNEWEKYEKAYPFKKSYILVYAIYWDKRLNKQLRELRDKTGLQIVSIQNAMRQIYSNKVVLDAGPAEFLWLLHHAEAVVTSSFHGTAFSIIFNKRFYPIINPSAPSRIESLLKTLNVHPANSISELLVYNADYYKVNKRILEEIQRSKEYLEKEIFYEE